MIVLLSATAYHTSRRTSITKKPDRNNEMNPVFTEKNRRYVMPNTAYLNFRKVAGQTGILFWRKI